MSLATEMNALTAAVISGQTAAAAQAEATLVEAARDKIQAQANAGQYSAVLQPGSSGSAYSQAQADTLVPRLEADGFTATAVTNVSPAGFRINVSWS